MCINKLGLIKRMWHIAMIMHDIEHIYGLSLLPETYYKGTTQLLWTIGVSVGSKIDRYIAKSRKTGRKTCRLSKKSM